MVQTLLNNAASTKIVGKPVISNFENQPRVFVSGHKNVARRDIAVHEVVLLQRFRSRKELSSESHDFMR